ncbi:hypothetical protein MHYP_G00187880 [Metynnis hypsauchen]
MAERKRSQVWSCFSCFSSTNSQDAVCDVCGKAVMSCGNTTNLVKHLRLNHNTEYEADRRGEHIVRCCCQGKTSASDGVLRYCRQALSRHIRCICT